MTCRPRAPCEPFFSAGGRVSSIHNDPIRTPPPTKKQPRKQAKLKMPPATLEAHIAMVTGSSTTPISSILSELRLPKRSPLSQLGSWQQPAADSLLSSPCLSLLHTYVGFRRRNWLFFSAGLRRTDTHTHRPTKNTGGKKGEIMNSLSDRSFGEPLETGHPTRTATPPPTTKRKASVMAMVHFMSV